jgi:hypothetical protein
MDIFFERVLDKIFITIIIITMKTTFLSLAAAASVLSSCETAPHHNVSVNHQVFMAGEPAHSAVGRIAPLDEVGKVKIDTADWAHYQHLLDEERREKKRNERFTREHIRDW